MNDLVYKIAITKIPLVGAVTAKSLISYCGGARAVFEARKRELLKIPGIGERIAENIVQQSVLDEAEAELDFLEKNGIQPLFYLDKNYPLRLKPFPDSPILLFYKGTTDLNADRTVAIIGTRKPSVYGTAICEELIDGLKPYNPVILSGLAYGIDVTAHRKSLDVGLETVGVLGHGLAQIYPAQHRTIAQQMLERGGLLTEYTSKTPPDRENFPMRNRIVAGLCDALIVVETAVKGGSMITAKFGNEYNKDVFAVPGRVKDKHSQGCNLLIKSHQAALVESAEDIAYVMRWEKAEAEGGVQRQLFVELEPNEQKIVDLLRQAEAVGIDRLTYESKLTNSEMAALLLNLEFKGIVKTLPGKRYVLVS